MWFMVVTNPPVGGRDMRKSFLLSGAFAALLLLLVIWSNLSKTHGTVYPGPTDMPMLRSHSTLPGGKLEPNWPQHLWSSRLVAKSINRS